jgi:hypothetical protein
LRVLGGGKVDFEGRVGCADGIVADVGRDKVVGVEVQTAGEYMGFQHSAPGRGECRFQPATS